MTSKAGMDLIWRGRLETLRATDHLAQKIAPYLRKGDFIALVGTLGAGKTAFARSIIRALAQDPGLDVPSPTFSLVQHYDQQNGLLIAVAHADLYRIEETDSVADLGLEDALDNGILLVEWPDRIANQHLESSLLCRFDIENDMRQISVYGGYQWQDRLAGDAFD